MPCLGFSRLTFFSLAAVLLNGTVCASASGAAAAPYAKKAPSTSSPAAQQEAKRALPLVFEENRGQLPEGTAFAGRTNSYTVQVRPSELQFGLPGKGKTRVVTLSFAGSKDAQAVGLVDAGFRTNFYLSNDPRTWHTNVHNFNRVALRGLYPGIEAQFYANGNEIEHDFIVAPGSDPSQLSMLLAGAKSAKLSSSGDVVLAGEEGALKLKKPFAYQMLADGSRKAVTADFVLAPKDGDSELTFKLGDYDRTRELVIDPVITYATYIAGDNGSTPSAVAADALGNVYLTGTTLSTQASFGAASTNLVPSTLPGSPAPTKVAFIARVSRTTSAGSSVNGSQIQWLTYYGATSTGAGDVTPNAIALQPATYTPVNGATTSGTLLYIAGQTTATGLPGTTNGGATTLSTGNSNYGFIAEFNEADGTAGSTTTYATYVDGGAAAGLNVTPQMDRTTNLQAITVDSTGAVTAVGDSSGTQYPTTAISLGTLVGLQTSFCRGNAQTANVYPKGLLTTLPATLGTPTYSTYVCGKAAGDTTNAYTLTGVSVATPATAAAQPTYIITGSTNLDFPMSGVYDFPTTTTADLQPVFFATPSSAVTNAFAALLNPNTLSVTWSYWSGGDTIDQANGLTVDSSGSTPQVFVFGSTTSSSIVTTSQTDPASTLTNGYMTLNAVLQQQSGFVIGLNPTTGAFGSATLLETTGANPATVTAAVPDGTGNLYLAGSMTGLKQSFPTQLVGGNRVDHPATLNLLPTAQDSSVDPNYRPGGSNYTASYLVRMPDSLASVDSLSYFGPPSYNGASTAVGVAIDAQDSATLPGATSTPLAYVLINETTAPASPSYTTADAESQVAQAGATNAAYLAQVAYVAPGAAASFTYDSSLATYTPNPVSYSSFGQSSVTITWPVQVAAAGTSQLVFNLPQSQYLSTYAAGMLTVMSGGTDVSADCALGTANTSANPAPNTSVTPAILGPGFTCVLPQVAGGTTVTFKLSNVPVSSSIPLGSTFQVVPTAYDATGQSLQLPVTIAAAGVPTLSLSDSVTVTNTAVNPNTASTTTSNAAAITVSAAKSASDTGTPNDQVTFTYTLSSVADSNGHTYDSPQTTLTAGLPMNFSAATFSCTITGGAACPTPSANYDLPSFDLPAGATLTYKVMGVFLANSFPANSSALTATMTTPSAAFGSPVVSGPTSVSGTAYNFVIKGNVTIALALTDASTSTASGLAYQVGETNVGFRLTITNTGLNQADSVSASVTLPNGFTVPTAPAGCTGSGTGPITCTTGALPGNSTTPATFTITGSFTDSGTSADAVAPPPTTTGAVSPSLLSGYSASAPVSAYVPISTVTVSSNQNTTPPPAASGTCSVSGLSGTPAAIACGTASRVNNATLTVSTVAPVANNTVNEVNASDTADRITFTATVVNAPTTAAPSVVRGLLVQIPIPSAGTVSDITNITVTSTPVSGTVSNANVLVCDAYTAGATFLNCYEKDLTAAGAATAPTATPAGITYTVSFQARYAETTVPLTTTGGTVQTANPPAATSFYAAAVSYTGGVNQSNALSGPFTIRRFAKLTSNVSVTPVGTGLPGTYADQQHLTLDTHTAGDIPGLFDTVVFTSTTYNSGVNDAAGVQISITIPAFMRVAVPQYCTLGTNGPSNALVSTGSSAATMICTPPSSTTPAGTSAGQLPAASAACSATAPSGATAATASYANGCLAVAFRGKFIDSSSTTGSITGSAATGAAAYVANTLQEYDVFDSQTVPAPSAATSITTIQRAAHVRLKMQLALPTDTANAALTKDPNGITQIAQAAPLMNPATRQPTGSLVWNCLRYEVDAVNDGPNYALSAGVNYTQSLNAAAGAPRFIATQYSNTNATTSPVNCASGNLAGPTLTPMAPPSLGATTSSAFIDGYFSQQTLGTTNVGSDTFATQAFTPLGYLDSSVGASDFTGSQTVTVVNTPYTDAAHPNVGVTAYGTTPLVSFIFNSVSAPGETAAYLSGKQPCAFPTTSAHGALPANVSNCFPYGVSPLPADNGAVRNLYQPGAKPQYYVTPTTAVVPSTASNPTTLCLTSSGAAFPDIFVKPERALLWQLAHETAGTTYQSLTATNYSSDAAQNGDVTSWVLPYSGTSYSAAPAVTFPQPPQAQPGQVCGIVNGLYQAAKAELASGDLASTTPVAATFGVLEPVNFPPVVVAGTLQTTSLSGKGSTTTLTDVYLQRTTSTATKYTYDYNDKDPCYVATASNPRQVCDDNPYLYAVVFSGGNTSEQPRAVAVTSLAAEAPVSGTPPPNSYQLDPNIALNGSANLFVAVADQATGADSYNTNITGTNPFVHQGNFLAGNSNSSAQVLCDPGNASVGGYTVTGTPCTGGIGGAQLGTQRYILGGQKNAGTAVSYTATPDLAGGYYVLGNVGAQPVNAQGSSTGISIGLIPLPYPGSSPTSATPLPLPASTVAASTITAGQTTGFYWPWLSTVTGTAGAAQAGDQYKLSCDRYDNATQQTVVAMPTGMTCSITTTTPQLTTSDPTIYTFSGGATASRGSTAPTIYISTQNGVLYGKSAPDWKRDAEGLALAMLLPAFFFRKRLGRGATLAILVLMLAAAPLLSGCGSGSSGSGSSVPNTPSGTYYFRVTATPIPNPGANGELPIRSAPFTVTIQ